MIHLPFLLLLLHVVNTSAPTSTLVVGSIVTFLPLLSIINLYIHTSDARSEPNSAR